MMTKQMHTLILAVALPLAAGFYTSSFAQNKPSRLAPQQKQQVLVSANSSLDQQLETLSGIQLYPAQKGTYELRFEQDLKENAVLEVKNKSGKLVFRKPVSIAKNESVWRYNMGKLKPDTYLIEVVTSDTTYWTKFKVGK
ncbi:hypothetical protein MKJ04_19615 [Pontibacter sp. E15-1]|uniref:hypothetical protein n=1 Tax=Pontibacter sp. E15-1 TaxID=2919918 RepID=UPI001F4FA3D2|nr:hypothetical protein [Pontibacter sp. E15-1]MCJ8167060.1 hypothetical protein [Pontibacter sp. E15-1]